MFQAKKEKQQRTALEKELQLIYRQEKKLARAARPSENPGWKAQVEKKIPEKVYTGLEQAFAKAFSVVFTSGKGVIEKSYDRNRIQEEYTVRDYAVRSRGIRKDWKQLRGNARGSDFRNLAITTVEGIGLGALGIGLPDIVVFISVLLKGIYETALNYGFSYESDREKYAILKMMELALYHGEDWEARNAGIDRILWDESLHVTDQELKEQMQHTAECFAMDMLLLKFIQGAPVVGILGGAGNPVYYRKIMQYVELKYRKRYLMNVKHDFQGNID